jgi:hypothetical protein
VTCIDESESCIQFCRLAQFGFQIACTFGSEHSAVARVKVTRREGGGHTITGEIGRLWVKREGASF